MKRLLIIALAAVVVGILAGVALTFYEFAGDTETFTNTAPEDARRAL